MKSHKHAIYIEAGKLFTAYPRMAARVTDLRGILQNVDTFPLNEDDIQLWAADVKAVTADFLALIEQTRTVIRTLNPTPAPSSPTTPD